MGDSEVEKEERKGLIIQMLSIALHIHIQHIPPSSPSTGKCWLYNRHWMLCSLENGKSFLHLLGKINALLYLVDTIYAKGLIFQFLVCSSPFFKLKFHLCALSVYSRKMGIFAKEFRMESYSLSNLMENRINFGRLTNWGVNYLWKVSRTFLEHIRIHRMSSLIFDKNVSSLAMRVICVR